MTSFRTCSTIKIKMTQRLVRESFIYLAQSFARRGLCRQSSRRLFHNSPCVLPAVEARPLGDQKPSLMRLWRYTVLVHHDEKLLFDSACLRDCCSCSHCVDPSNGQKLFETADIPIDIKGVPTEEQPDGSCTVKWQNDVPGFENHISTYSAAFLSRSMTGGSISEARLDDILPILWDKENLNKKSMTVSYGHYMESSAVLHAALGHLLYYGLFFISSVPTESGSVSAIAERIGPLRNSIYGLTWDVKSVPSAENIAYTSGNLGFHMVSPSGQFELRLLISDIDCLGGLALLRESAGTTIAALHERKHRGRRVSL